ncbi:hypothetical protein VUR80DRAFT_1761 [Thermomyces stellatus]
MPRRKKDQGIRKYLQPREHNEDPPGPETPSRRRRDVTEIDGGAGRSLRADSEMDRDEQQGQGPAARPPTPPVPADRSDPTTPIRRPPNRRREDDDDKYSLPDFSPSEEEQVEQILSAASCRTIMSPPPASAETPSRRPNPSLSTPARPARPPSATATPSTKSSLGATRRRILDSNNSLSSNPTTPQNGDSDSPQPHTPNAEIAASINADLSSLRALLAPHLDASVSSQLDTHLSRISMKVRNASYQRNMLRGALDKCKKEVAVLTARKTALEDEVRMLREARAKMRGKMLEIYKDT